MLTLVIAGSAKQFQYWMRKRGENERACKYVYSVEGLRGWDKFRIILTGTWWESPVWRELSDVEASGILRSAKIDRV